ncbi:MAG: hypothetical protein IPJ41_16970 [Phycisphaerales bacterium]|nr:hypothetical protein [Phycisphaerales bacterium]
MSRVSPVRRGVALLLVLATLVLAVTAAAGLARASAGARLRAQWAGEERIADTLLDASEVPILDWLHRHAGRLVLPPDAASPRFMVLDDQMAVDGEACRVTIAAFDECGMAPAGWHGAGFPAEVSARVEGAGGEFTNSPGLDLFPRLSLGAEGRPAFPSAGGASMLSIGELVATHNPVRRGQQPAVNVNTAPMRLLKAVYAARALGGLEAIIEARAAGRVASPGAVRAPQRSHGLGGEVPLPVAMSTCWAFRIDCRVGRLRYGWWCLYADRGSNWERVQRLAITE